MNKAVFVLIGIAVLALSCTRTEQPQAAPFVIFADLGGNDDVKTTLYDPDTGFTSTIGEETGAFAFTPNDQIKTNAGASENRSAFIQGFSTPMQRAHFRKLGVSFTKTSDYR